MSTFGLLATVVMLSVLAVLLWRTGGLAFSPGKLSAIRQPGVTLKGFASHEAFETECSRCHQPLKTRQVALCLDCHTRVAAQLERGEGAHSQMVNVQQCYACHSDHQGRDFDLRRAAYAYFDHTKVNFSLLRHQVDYDASAIACIACHQESAEFTVLESNCSLCHAKKDLAFVVQHSQDFGTTCTDCHDGQDRLADFDHKTTAFHLEGKHAQAHCTDCHAFQQANRGRIGEGSHIGSPVGSPISLFSGAPLECAGCHDEIDPHAGMASSECGECHAPDGWSPAKWEEAPFDHAAQAGFSLYRHRQDYDGSPLSCNDCHLWNARDFDLGSCVSCHSLGEERATFMRQHQEQYGAGCTACHDGDDRMSGFSHESVFPLEGKHDGIACQDCHAGQVFAGTPNACVQCHAEPAIHAGFFGMDCQYCHTSQAWSPALLRMHGFPLDHGEQGEVACRTCHLESYVEYTCYGCHEHQPGEIAEEHQEEGIRGDALLDCAECHPTGDE